MTKAELETELRFGQKSYNNPESFVELATEVRFGKAAKVCNLEGITELPTEVGFGEDAKKYTRGHP